MRTITISTKCMHNMKPIAFNMWKNKPTEFDCSTFNFFNSNGYYKVIN